MPIPRFRYAFLLLFAFGLLTAGCIPTETVRYDRRVPSVRHTSARPSPAHTRVNRDARRYVRDLDRALRLNHRQERRIERLLTERALDRFYRTRHRDWHRANPFPRRYDHRATRGWWDRTDRRIERELNRHQRRAYRDWVRYAEHRARRDRRHRDYRPRRHDDRRHDDRRRWDDDDRWDDDRDDDWDDDGD